MVDSNVLSRSSEPLGTRLRAATKAALKREYGKLSWAWRDLVERHPDWDLPQNSFYAYLSGRVPLSLELWSQLLEAFPAIDSVRLMAEAGLALELLHDEPHLQLRLAAGWPSRTGSQIKKLVAGLPKRLRLPEDVVFPAQLAQLEAQKDQSLAFTLWDSEEEILLLLRRIKARSNPQANAAFPSILGFYGSLLASRGSIDEASEAVALALEILRERRESTPYLALRVRSATLLGMMGRYRLSVRHLLEVELPLRMRNEKVWASRALIALARGYAALGRVRLALQILAETARDAPSAQLVGLAVANRIGLLIDHGHHEEAMQVSVESADALAQLGSRQSFLARRFIADAFSSVLPTQAVEQYRTLFDSDLSEISADQLFITFFAAARHFVEFGSRDDRIALVHRVRPELSRLSPLAPVATQCVVAASQLLDGSASGRELEALRRRFVNALEEAQII